MEKIAVLGAGKVGALVTTLLADTNDYSVVLIDQQFHASAELQYEQYANVTLKQLDCTKQKAFSDYVKATQIDTLVSCLPYYCNVVIAETAHALGLHYFDLTEDVSVTETISALSQDTSGLFASQCGLAPGFISIVTNHLCQAFDAVDSVRMRVGALPVNVSNALQYGLTWSTAGLINEYMQPCQVLENGCLETRQPLEGLEEIKIDGLTYEAFNTSGGVGSLVHSCLGKVNSMDYKTIRYPGHCEKMQFLMHALSLAKNHVYFRKLLSVPFRRLHRMLC